MILKIVFKDGETCSYIAGSIHTYKNYITIHDKQGRILRTIPQYAIKSLYYNSSDYAIKSLYYGYRVMYTVEIYTLTGEHILEEECYINLFNDAMNIYDLFGDLIHVIPMSQIKAIICNQVKKAKL